MNSVPSLKQHAGSADFGRTRWSVVAAVRSGSEADARESLSDLCRRYWVPVYTYVRRCGHPPQSAAARNRRSPQIRIKPSAFFETITGCKMPFSLMESANS